MGQQPAPGSDLALPSRPEPQGLEDRSVVLAFELTHARRCHARCRGVRSAEER
jgi:hypothetical protein